jgi:hypothetical protein
MQKQFNKNSGGFGEMMKKMILILLIRLKSHLKANLYKKFLFKMMHPSSKKMKMKPKMKVRVRTTTKI